MFQGGSNSYRNVEDVPLSFLQYSPANTDSTMGNSISATSLVNQLDMSGFIDNPTESINGRLSRDLSFSLQSTPKVQTQEPRILLPNKMQTPARPKQVELNQQQEQQGHHQNQEAEIERIALSIFSQWRSKEKEQMRSEIRKEIIDELQGQQHQTKISTTQAPVSDLLGSEQQPRIVSYNTELSLKDDINTATTSPVTSPKETSFIDLQDKLSYEKSKISELGNVQLPINILQGNNEQILQNEEIRKLKKQSENYKNTIDGLSNEISNCKNVISECKRENDSLKLLIRELFGKLNNSGPDKYQANKAKNENGTSNHVFKNGVDRITQTTTSKKDIATAPPPPQPQQQSTPKHESGQSGKSGSDFTCYPPEVRNRLTHINAHKLDNLSEQELRYILRNLMYVLMIDYDVIQSKSMKYAKFISLASQFIDGVHDRLYPNGGILRTGILLKCDNNIADDKTMERLNNCLHDMLENITNQ
ncbi:hypothetical protein JA1_004830 [Spathaspora sp. JA1]|nr:hypothetical protein JA1_004830 [Spathaspora sp. JA1]